MNTTILEIKSASIGDPARYHTLEHLEQSLAAMPAAPRDHGRVAIIVRRGEGGRRELPERIAMTPESGVPGDAWGRDPQPLPEAQLAVIQLDIVELIANGQPAVLSGDNLYFELDLSTENLPIGSRLRVGTALMEVTPMAHNGCQKFRARFGPDALQFVSKPDLRHRNLRGIYLRVVEAGEVAVGDTARVVSRAITSAKKLTEKKFPPIGCTWWSPGDSTMNPPQDAQFLLRVAESGFATFTGSAGLVGAQSGNRGVYVIHRGMGTKWELSFAEGDSDVYATMVTELPKKAEAVVAWLNRMSVESVRQILESR